MALLIGPCGSYQLFISAIMFSAPSSTMRTYLHLEGAFCL